jgi:putative SOS response-associated peptidase YedK
MINARAETVAEKPAFRSAFRRRRCLVAADGFFEWIKAGSRKQPYHIRMRDGAPFGFAGLWERWKNPDGETVESCTLITTDPNDLLRPLHHRMPVILAPADYAAWMDPDSRNPEPLRELLRPYPAAGMEAYPVSLRVNSPGNDDRDIIEPIETD